MDKMDKIKQFKEWECKCNACQKMCDRPCFGTVADIKKLIENGYSDRLCLDWNQDPSNPTLDVAFLTPALKDYEGKLSPAFPMSKKGCNFLKGGLCSLHDLKLKPLEGRTAIHQLHDKELNKKNSLQREEVKKYILEDWKSEEGQALVDDWCKQHNIKSKERDIDYIEFMCQHVDYLSSQYLP